MLPLWYLVCCTVHTALFYPVFQIRDILRRTWVRIRIFKSCQWITDPDPALFVSGFKDVNKMSVFLRITLLSVGTVISVFKDFKSWTSHKTVEIKSFLIYLLVDGRIRIRIRTIKNGSGSWRSTDLRIWIRTTDFILVVSCLYFHTSFSIMWTEPIPGVQMLETNGARHQPGEWQVQKRDVLDNFWIEGTVFQKGRKYTFYVFFHNT
jgi:hypothetical protein